MRLPITPAVVAAAELLAVVLPAELELVVLLVLLVLVGLGLQRWSVQQLLRSWGCLCSVKMQAIVVIN